jgi:tRNA(fMet)-specific endonuclease VapC
VISHVLDTNAVIALLGGRSEKLAQRVFARPPGAVALPTIVAHELYFGAFRSRRVAHNLETLRLLTADVPVLEFDANDALVSGDVHASLATKGTPIGPYDVLIAGQAKARGLTVVTNNTGEFERIAGLSVEDWTR